MEFEKAADFFKNYNPFNESSKNKNRNIKNQNRTIGTPTVSTNSNTNNGFSFSDLFTNRYDACSDNKRQKLS